MDVNYLQNFIKMILISTESVKRESFQDKLLGLGVDERHRNKPLDVSQIKVIVFDEILLYSRKNLSNINKFMRKHSHIRFLATGDPYQLPAIEESPHYIRGNLECVNLMFPYRVVLNVIKRLNPEEMDSYPIIKKLLFEDKKTPIEIITSFVQLFGGIIKDKQSIMTRNNICYTNYTRMALNDYIQHHILKKKNRLKGDCYVCKGYVKEKLTKKTKDWFQKERKKSNEK